MKTLHVKIKDDGKAAAIQQLLCELPFVEVEEEKKQELDVKQRIMKHAGMLKDLSDTDAEFFNHTIKRKALLGDRNVWL